MSSHKRIQSDSSVPDSHLEGPYYYDSGDDEISLSDDKSIEALSDSDSDDYEIFMMSSKSDLRSQVSFMDTNEDETVKSKDGTKWSPSFVPFEERQFPKILHGIPRECNNFTSVIEAFKVFFSDSIISKIQYYSNSKLRQFLATKKDVSGRYFNEFTFEEMQAFIGLMILTGVFRVSREPLSKLYSQDPNFSRIIIKATLPRERFTTILRFLRFDDFSCSFCIPQNLS